MTNATKQHKRLVAEVFAKTHSDYKGKRDGKHYVLRMTAQGTRPVELESLSLEELEAL